jgi:hypothetical protein
MALAGPLPINMALLTELAGESLPLFHRKQRRAAIPPPGAGVSLRVASGKPPGGSRVPTGWLPVSLRVASGAAHLPVKHHESVLVEQRVHQHGSVCGDHQK